MNCSSSVIHPNIALDLVSPQSFDEFVRHQVRSVPGPQGPRSHRQARSCGVRKAQLGICRQLRPIGAAALEFSAQVDFRAAHLPLMCVVAQVSSRFEAGLKRRCVHGAQMLAKVT